MVHFIAPSETNDVHKDIAHMARYYLVSISIYLSIFVLMYIFVEFFLLLELTAFVLVYALAYLANYFINLSVTSAASFNSLKHHSYGYDMKGINSGFSIL